MTRTTTKEQEAKLFRRKKLLWRKEKEGLLIINDTGIYLLNGTGSDIWLYCDKPRTLNEIIEYLSEIYNIEGMDTNKLMVMVTNFLHELLELGLVECIGLKDICD